MRTIVRIQWRCRLEALVLMLSAGYVSAKAASDKVPDIAVVSNVYMVVDVSGGPTAAHYHVAYLSSQPPLDDTFKTTKILLRKIPAGSFVMGSPTNECGRRRNENQHRVTLSSDFYMGVFEITQAQYMNVMGTNPSYCVGAMRPVETVSWNTVRCGTWPCGTPGSVTFMGKLRTKTRLSFDLPTESQWEYACRAGTTTALNNGMNVQPEIDQNASSWRCTWCFTDVHAVVGSYPANNWGLYDMDGNVAEFCLDWYGAYPAVVGSYLANDYWLYDMHDNVGESHLDWYGAYTGDTIDPLGPAMGSFRILRGGSWTVPKEECRSAFRLPCLPDSSDFKVGFRLVLPACQH